jgi:REP element-mobilizing transposase RayT
MAQAIVGAPSWGRLRNPTHLVTLRLAGILSDKRLQELRVWRDEQLALVPSEPRLARDFRTRIQQRFFTEYDYLLDEHRDNVLLADQRLGALVRRQLLAAAKQGYLLLAYAVMPNHVHAVLEVSAQPAAEAAAPASEPPPDREVFSVVPDEEPDEKSPLADFLRQFKHETATEAFALLDDGRELKWHSGTFDFWIRSETELEAVIEYIAQNPVEAGLVQSPEQWFFCSAHERFLYDATTNGWQPRYD